MQPNNTSRDVLLALRERVLAAKGADRSLFADIVVALATEEHEVPWAEVMRLVDARAWTDAALSIVAATLPRAGILTETRNDGFVMVWIRPNINEPINGKRYQEAPWSGDVREYGTEFPVAILKAFVLALISKGQTHG